jgi:hypothetical protein
LTDDPRAIEAREHQHLALTATGDADAHRNRRNALVRELRAEDPKRWTYPALAAAVDIGEELARAIVNGRTPR